MSAGRRARDAAILGAPVAAAVAVFGVSFGILARAAGFGVAAPIVMSATIFAGSAQFAIVSVLGGGSAAAAAIVAAVLLNSRYFPIGVSVAPSLSGGPVRRFFQGQLVVDESWALANRGDGRFDVRTLLVVGLMLYAAWVGGTTIGVISGSSLGDPNALGLDAALPALFLALLLPQLKSRRALRVAIGGGAIAFLLIPFSPPGVPIVAASAASLVGLRRG